MAKRKFAEIVRAIRDGEPTERAARAESRLATLTHDAEEHFRSRESRGVVIVRDEQIYYRLHIAPHIDAIGCGEVERVPSAAVDSGLRRNSVRNVRSVAHRIFDELWRQEIVKQNPVLRTRVPRMREVKKERVILTDEDFYKLMACPDVGVEIKLMSLVSRTLGGMRASDVMRWDWR